MEHIKLKIGGLPYFFLRDGDGSLNLSTKQVWSNGAMAALAPKSRSVCDNIYTRPTSQNAIIKHIKRGELGRYKDFSTEKLQLVWTELGLIWLAHHLDTQVDLLGDNDPLRHSVIRDAGVYAAAGLFSLQQFQNKHKKFNKLGYFYVCCLTPQEYPAKLKVGFTTDITQRTATYRTICPKAVMIRTIPIDKKDEKHIIDKLKDLSITTPCFTHYGGECFMAPSCDDVTFLTETVETISCIFALRHAKDFINARN